MAFPWADNLHSTAFTPRDFQVELLAAADEKNVIICLGHNSSKEFIALKLILERGHELRRQNADRKISIYITSEMTNGDSTYNLLFHLTDLKVINLNAISRNLIEWDDVLDKYQVLILNVDLFLDTLICSCIDVANINLLVVEECHKKYGIYEMEQIFEFIRQSRPRPKVLGLAGPLHSAGCVPGQLGFHLNYLENALDCKAETASDIVTVLRYCSKPTEIVLQCAPLDENELTIFLRDLLKTKIGFLNDHRFDPSEIYSDDLLEELKKIPDPKQEPLDALNQCLEVLEEFGPWTADRAALTLLMQIEKSKVKTPYERNFLLLCMVSTTFIQIRAHCEYVFQSLPTEKERIEKYSSPKVLRVLEILRLFAPEKKPMPEHKESEVAKNTANELNSLDFKKLSANIDSICDQLEATHFNETKNLKQSLNKMLKDDPTAGSNPAETNKTSTPVQPQFRSFRNRKLQTHRTARTIHQNDPNALCGLVFCNSKFTAKMLFGLFYEISKSDPQLDYLMVQFTVDRTADPITETKQAENEHRKQEEVLKRFRMHSCNLLIGTAVLEEGIELPKCNLVIRWNPPTTYRSYVQCKGRARAHQAYHVIMVAPAKNNSDVVICDTLPDRSHIMICPPSLNLMDKLMPQINGHENDSSGSDEINEVTDEDSSSKDEPSDQVSNSNMIEATIVHVNGHVDMSDDSELEQIDTNEHERDILNLLNNYSCAVDRTAAENDIKEILAMNNTIVPLATMDEITKETISRLAQYREIEKMLLSKCNNKEPPEAEISQADQFTSCIKPYQPMIENPDGPSVNLSSAILLVNKYCAKLPSDTFTKLTALWRCARTQRNGINFYQYTLRLPINSPLKQDILGLPMPSRTLARRMAALIACKILHQSGELDDLLQPIGKEGFRASEPDWDVDLEKVDEDIVNDNLEPRPGTTRRRQYYYKKIASVFCDCRPKVGLSTYLYHIKMTLECPIPEEQNTRGRKIYPPEDSPQGFGLLTLKKIPKLSAFSIFTRSGEVKVSLELSKTNIILNDTQLEQINTFLKYSFANVLRLQKYLMLFDTEANENSFLVVPTISNDNHEIDVDWSFLQIIDDNSNVMPTHIPDDIRAEQAFNPHRFVDAVVMPWYRNQGQPQYFYVAEICDYLSPESAFPGDNYKTFKEYYFRKYEIEIQNCAQPLLDVDHTSARLNFLTPRYVNRKGVALPTSSEETKRAKRENLEQKQILVPELCTIHPFPASLWRAAVCLPCILYRFNALLLADEIRKQVAHDIGLGVDSIDDTDIEWSALDFGWSLADVLQRAKDSTIFGDHILDDENNTKNGSKINEPKIKKESHDAKIAIKDSLDASKTANDILDAVDRKLKETQLEIGTWSNEMADNIDMDDSLSEEDWGILPPNINICSSDKTLVRYGSPTSWDIAPNKPNQSNYYSESEESYQSEADDDYHNNSNDSVENGCLKIQFKSDNVAEAIESEEDIQKRQRQLEIINDINANEKYYQITKNIGSGYDCPINADNAVVKKELESYEITFNESIEKFQNDIKTSGTLVTHNQPVIVTKSKRTNLTPLIEVNADVLAQLIPFMSKSLLSEFIESRARADANGNVQLSLSDFYDIHKMYYANAGDIELYHIEGSGTLFDKFNDNAHIVETNGEYILTLHSNDLFRDRVLTRHKITDATEICVVNALNDSGFSFDRQPNLNNHPGPSPSIILQALTMSNANDGINLERLETIGDSFLKYAITTYLYCTYENVHEGKLSHLRSRQVSNLNLYRLGRRKILGEFMIATKFEPHDNWLPPCYYVPKDLEKALIEAKIPSCYWDIASLPNVKNLSVEEICRLLKEKTFGYMDEEDLNSDDEKDEFNKINETIADTIDDPDIFPCFIPYNLITQHSIPDKSIADCVEALIGAYLIDCGPRGALLFMAWLGIRVLPCKELLYDESMTNEKRITGSTRPYEKDGKRFQTTYGYWAAPKSPLLHFAPNPCESLELMLDGYSNFETHIGYQFRDRSYLLQAMTHASYSPNRLTDCYQRLEFLGDAVLDYLITRHLYEDPRQHSPGALTDLRSALVNNTIFASLAVRHGFHKYFRHLSPGLNDVIDRFVRIQHENGHSISEEFYLISEEECDEAEDVEVPKALGDVFESVAGAIFLDSNMSLDTVWKVYSNMMRPEIEQFSNSVPKSPIRELLELEPETAKFSKPEKLADGRRVRVTVEVFGKGTYRGIGRNFRIAKCTAAKCALRQLKKQGLINRKH